MPPEKLAIGLKHSKSIRIDDSLTVPAVSPQFGSFQDMPPVFATAFLVGFVESVCIEALGPYLDPGQKTVGTHVDLSHSAATPAGMTVTADVELVSIDGRSLRFKVQCRDDVDIICEGFHGRAIVALDRFMGRVNAKRSRAPVA